MSSGIKNLNISSVLVLQKMLEDINLTCIIGLNTIYASLNLNTVKQLNLKNLLGIRKFIVTSKITRLFTGCLFNNIYVMLVEHLNQQALCYYDCFIISFHDCFFPVSMTLACKKFFSYALKIFICYNTIFGNVFKKFCNSSFSK